MALTAKVKEILEAQGYDPAEVQSAAINEETGKLEIVLAETEGVEGEPMPEVEVVTAQKKRNRMPRTSAAQVRVLRNGAKRNNLRAAAGNQVVVTLYNEGFSKSGKTIKFQTPEDAPVWASGAIAIDAFDGLSTAQRKSIRIVVG